jgi:light-regulated signal transduction histidine kinase (bacteriophytochrome)
VARSETGHSAERYEFLVHDNGIGIAPRYHEQIFRVFERLHTSKEYEGAGIGLAIVKKAASKLGGSVRVESKLGEGSTFFVTLPNVKRET